MAKRTAMNKAKAKTVARAGRPATPRAPEALNADGVTKSYGDLIALEPLDLRITTGSLVALIGHNGSGKSTFLRLAAGLLDADGGSVTVGEHVAGSIEARAAVSFLPDTPVLYDDLSLWEHIEYLGRLHGATDWQPRGRELVDRFGLAERVDDLPRGFSRGLRQKTAIILGFLRPFEVMLVDEPFVGLDASGKATLIELLVEARDQGRTVVVATHDLALLEKVDRCLALRDGAVVHDGKVDPHTVLQLAG